MDSTSKVDVSLVTPESSIGMSSFDGPLVVPAAPCINRYGEGCTRSSDPCYKIEVDGVNGYVYSVIYESGKVTLCVRYRSGCVSVDGASVSMCVKDRKLFRSVICSDLDQTGFPETWISVIAETFLHDLVVAENITEVLAQMYDELVSDDVLRVALLRECGSFWREGSL